MSKDCITFEPKRWIFQIQLYCKILFLLGIMLTLCWFITYRIQERTIINYGLFALLCCVIYYWRITNLRILLQYYNLHKNCQLIIDKEKNKIIYITPKQTIEFSEDNIVNLTVTYCKTRITDKYYYEIYLKGEEYPIIFTSILCKKLEKQLNLIYHIKTKNNMLIHKKIKKGYGYTQIPKEKIDNNQLNIKRVNASDIVFNADKKYYRKMIFRNIAAILTTNIIIAYTAHKYTDYRMVIASYILLNSIFIISLVTIIKEYSINKRDSLIIHKDSNKFTYCTENRKIEFTQEDIISFKYFRNHIKYDYYEIHIKQCESPIVITSLFCKDLNKYISKKYELIRKKNFINVPRNKNQS